MGLTSWRGDQIHRTDVEVAKNYLSQPELDALNKIVRQSAAGSGATARRIWRWSLSLQRSSA